NLECTTELTLLPTLVLPVNETSLILLSLINLSPTIGPVPHTIVNTPPKPHLSRTSTTILVTATVIKLVVSEPFHIVKSPQTRETAVFHIRTAAGKLKAVITPISPKGFQFSIIV